MSRFKKNFMQKQRLQNTQYRPKLQFNIKNLDLNKTGTNDQQLLLIYYYRDRNTDKLNEQIKENSAAKRQIQVLIHEQIQQNQKEYNINQNGQYFSSSQSKQSLLSKYKNLNQFSSNSGNHKQNS